MHGINKEVHLAEDVSTMWHGLRDIVNIRNETWDGGHDTHKWCPQDNHRERRNGCAKILP